MNKKLFLLLAGWSLATAVAADTQVFRLEGGNGIPHFSDRPHPDAALMTLKASASAYRVKKVLDGDTIVLENGDKVRFLGVNTPEIAGQNKQAQAGGQAAKQWLIEKIGQEAVYLERDVEKTDQYGRILAHVFTAQKQHLNLELVRNGLGMVNIYPPNLKYSAALIAAQQQAQTDKRGVWRLPDYQPQAAAAMDEDNYRGWKRLTGQIKAVKNARSYSYLQLADNVAVKIDKDWLSLFPPLSGYLHHAVEARGWVGKSAQGFVITVRHPSDLVLLK